MNSYKILVGVLLFLATSLSFGQISPPGLGIGKTASWLAVGLRQELDTVKGKGWQSVSYIGFGRKSNPDNSDPFFKSAILVLNQEFYHPLRKHWQYSFAFSYRRQDEYVDSSPFLHESPAIKQEFRLYGRFSAVLKTHRLRFVPTFRQEYRKFMTPDFHDINEEFQLRTRFRLQLTVNLDQQQKHKLTAASEQLFSISKTSIPSGWTAFTYKESRFTLFYSVSPKSMPVSFHLGYMNNLIGRHSPLSVHYLALNLVLENPFPLRSHKG